MSKKLFFVGVIFLLLVTTAATPFSVRAEGDSPPNPEPVKPPWITGKNPLVSISSNPEEDLTASGIIDTWQGVEVPLLAAPPTYVDLEPQSYQDSPPDVRSLAIPQRYQNPEDMTCGAAALGMALEFLSLNGEGASPSQETLVNNLKNSGLLYETGTGVEELAFLARQYGYQGTTAFHDWTLEQLGGQLAAGRPVVVSLGANGADQPGHFVTLTGISEDGSWVSYNDPVLGNQTISAETFLKSWNLQGNSGLVVQKEPLSAAADPMLPWMGLFSALTMLAVMAKEYPLGRELTSTLEIVRNILSHPLRKGLAGKLIAEGGSKTAPRGYKWVKKTVPVYGWKDSKITLKRQVPILGRKKILAGTRVTYEKVPRYRTVRVNEGSWATRKVTKYRRQKYVRYYRTTRVRKTRWVRKGWRWVRQTYYVTKRTPVYGYRSVAYGTKTERYWKSNWVTKQVPDGYRSVRKETPVYEYRMLPTGRTRTEYYTDTERRWGQIGTDIKWELKQDPTPPPPTPTPAPSRAPEPPVTTPVPPYQTAVTEPGLLEKISDPEWWQEKVKEAGKKLQDQKIISLSASDKFDFSVYSQAGLIGYSTPVDLFFANQNFIVDEKVKVTGNPGSIADVDVISQTITVNLTKDISVFGSLQGLTVGFGKRRSEATPLDNEDIVDKHSFGLTAGGITHTYRQETTEVDYVNKEENYEVKSVTTIACETQTIRTVGLVLIGGTIVVAALLGPEILALGAGPVLDKLNPAFGH